MPYYKFKPEDIYYNRIKTYPQQNFVIYDAKVYINGFKNHKGEFNNIHATKQGFLSLYELNVDRGIDQSNDPPGSGSIYPFITKEGARVAFKTISVSEFDSTSQYAYGDTIKGKYPLTASIKRIKFAASSNPIIEMSEDNGNFKKVSNNKKFILALRNSFNEYVHMSKHYAFDSSSTSAKIQWDKAKQEMGLIEVPSIFYGSSIRKGSVSLKFYITGALAAELRDSRKNGELIQVSGTLGSSVDDNDKVAGVVLYNEGFIALTGSWSLNKNWQDKYIGTDYSNPRWVDFGVGAHDGTSAGNVSGSLFELNFQGVNYVPVMTLLAHTPRGAMNNSTNPTFLESGQTLTAKSGSHHFVEYDEVKIKNLSHSAFMGPSGSFKKQTYISKIGIYDEHRRLIGIAKLANPVRKTEEREYTFKMKMDY